MPSASSSGAEPDSSSSSAKSREHNQGRQDREYTSAQKAAVDKIRKCKATAYYDILDLKVNANEGEIKKAYRKLALIMHPDKNGAPGADEAFKLVSRAFQVLSDPDKRAAFDRHGGDPDARGGGGGSDTPMRGFGGSPFGFPRASGRGGPMYGDEISPEELFEMFFGAGVGAGGGFFGGGMGGFQTFGGPGIRIHQFGGQRRRRPAQGATQQPEAEQSFVRILIQLLPLIVFFLLPILGAIFTGDNSEKLRGPAFRLERVPPFTDRHETPNYNIPFWVNPNDLEEMKKGDIANLGKMAETTIINRCRQEQKDLAEERNSAQGWLFIDQEKLRKANERPRPNCQKLEELHIRVGMP